jgi:hypothetical protein
MTPMWEALGFIVLGVCLGLIGRHYRLQYFREFDAARASADPAYRMNAQLMQRFVAIFLTSGAMMIIVGLCFAANEIWAVLRRG